MSPDSYQSFLLRLWNRGEPPFPESLLMLENTRTGERLFFARVAELAAYLEAQAARPPDGDRPAQRVEPR